MDNSTRRTAIQNLLCNTDMPITGNDLATRFKVSRQIIVQDIALLRAAGEEILATPQGYVGMKNYGCGTPRILRTFAVKHSFDDLEKELYIFVNHGAKVLDVIVEHPLYGELKGMLMLASRRDVADFMEGLKKTNAHPLSILTEGVHLHTIEADHPQTMEKIAQDLKRTGILL